MVQERVFRCVGGRHGAATRTGNRPGRPARAHGAGPDLPGPPRRQSASAGLRPPAPPGGSCPCRPARALSRAGSQGRSGDCTGRRVPRHGQSARLGVREGASGGRWWTLRSWPAPVPRLTRRAARAAATKVARCSGATCSTAAKRSAIARDGRRRSPSMERIIVTEQPTCSASTSCVRSCWTRSCLIQSLNWSGVSMR